MVLIIASLPTISKLQREIHISVYTEVFFALSHYKSCYTFASELATCL